MIENQTNCSLCPRNCPMDALHCNRGRIAAGQTPREQGCAHNGGSHGHHAHGQPNDNANARPRCAHARAKQEGGEASLTHLLARSGRFLLHHGGFSRGQSRILEILGQHQSIGQKQLQDMLDIQPGSLSEVLTKLESKALIVRQKEETDKRAVLLQITDAGRAYVEKMHEPQSEEELFSALTMQERAQLRTLLQKLQDSWPKGRCGHHGPHGHHEGHACRGHHAHHGHHEHHEHPTSQG